MKMQTPNNDSEPECDRSTMLMWKRRGEREQEEKTHTLHRDDASSPMSAVTAGCLTRHLQSTKKL